MDLLKISDPELRDFARELGTDVPRSVIVELNLMGLNMNAEPIALGDHSARRLVPAELDADAARREKEGMDSLERELTSLGLGKDLVRLNTASAFVVKVSPEQLRTVSTIPLVGVVRPNRMHSVPFR